MKLLENFFFAKRESAQEKEIHALQILNSGELAAVDCYGLAIRLIEDKQLIPVLEGALESHLKRCDFYASCLYKVTDGNKESAQWWRSIAHFTEFCASFISDRVMLSVLAAGEDFGYEQYIIHMPELDSKTYLQVKAELFPAQSKTLQTMSLLCACLCSEEQAHAQLSNAVKLEPVQVPDAVQYVQYPLSGEYPLPKAS